MTIAITGAAGNLGRHITSALDRTGRDYRVIARRAPVGPVDHEHVVVAGGYDDADRLTEALRGVDSVFLMSTPDLPEVRIPRHRNAIGAALRAGVGHVVFLSLHDAVPGSPFPFAAANADAESVLRTSGADWTLLAPNIYAEAIAAQTAPTVASTGVLDLPFGDGRAGYVTRADIAAVVAAVLTTPGHAGATYEITGPAAHSGEEIAQMLTHLLGRPIGYTPLTEQDYVATLTAHGLSEVTARAFAGLGAAIAQSRFDLVTSSVLDLTGRAATPLAEHLATEAGLFGPRA